MPNAFTRVPDRPVPPLPAWAHPLLPAADLFMVLMYSRPPTGTLRTTWVTPSTFWLGVALAAGWIVLGVVLVARGGPVLIALGLLLILFALGCGSVAAIGLAQRSARQ